MCMNTSNVIKTLKLLRFIDRVSRKVTIGKFKMLQIFRNERRHGTGFLKKD